MGMQVDPYALQRSTGSSGPTAPHLAPLSIPGSSSNGVHGFSPSYPDYSLDSARNGLSRHNTRAAHPTFVGGDSDESYFNYMLGEIPTNADDLFPTGDGSSHSGIGLIGSSNGEVEDFQYSAPPSSNHFRDPGLAPPQISSAFSSGNNGHTRSSSYQHLPPMPSYVSHGFDLR